MQLDNELHKRQRKAICGKGPVRKLKGVRMLVRTPGLSLEMAEAVATAAADVADSCESAAQAAAEAAAAAAKAAAEAVANVEVAAAAAASVRLTSCRNRIKH